MLNLLGTSPAWRADDQVHALPNTLPGWTIAFLAAEGDWVARERLLALLWPEAASAEAQHNLRVNLHRARTLLADWGLSDALESERRRVRLSLPTDVAALRQALATPAQAAPQFPGALLPSMTFAGFAALREWADLERRSLAEAWREAALAWADRADATPAELQAACQQMLQADALDEQALLRMLQSLHAQARFADVDRHYAAYRERLAKELGVEPSAALRAFAESTGTAAAPPAEGAADTQAFVGRRLELAELARRFDQGARLVTLVGPGGIGKSSLARQALGKLAEPATWIDLQDLERIEAVAARIAQRLEIDLRDDRDAAAQIARGLGDEPRVIALDNAEHLVDTLAPFAKGLLDAAPALKLLVTSRHPLGLAGESLLPLEGLAVPDVDSRDAEAASSFDAVRLFELRARAVRRGFELAPHIDAVIQVVNAVGGTPLAIELAATWVRLMPPAQIARDLGESIAMLERDPMRGGSAARPEHASMSAVLERSWQLLAEHERAALAALTVFRGGFTPDAARAAADVGLPLISTLLDKALLTSPCEGRFDLHPLVAFFARSRIDGETLVLQRDRHARHFASVAEAIRAQSLSKPRAAIAAFSVEESNLREAWQHAWNRRRWADERPLSGAWRNCCQYAGRYSEVIALLGLALNDEFNADDIDSQAAAARVHAHVALCLMLKGEIDRARAVAQSCIALASASGERPSLSNGLSVAGHCHHMRNQWSHARQHFEQALAVARADGNHQYVASALNNLGLVVRDEGHYGEALAMHEQALAGYQALDMPHQMAQCLLNVAEVHKARRDFSLASEPIERARRLCHEHDLTGFTPDLERTLGSLYLETGRVDAARTHAQRALELAMEQEADEIVWNARMDLARLSHRLGHHDDAMERFRELARMAATGDHDKFTLALYFAEYLRDAGRCAEAVPLWLAVSEADGAVSYIRAEARRNLAAIQPPAGGDGRHETDLATLLGRILPP